MSTAAVARAVPVVSMFLAFACAYFLSTLLRASPATLAEALTAELRLSAGDLGLLAGAYFLGFSSTQLPLGHALDRFGPRRVIVVLLVLATLACVWFARAGSLGELPELAQRHAVQAPALLVVGEVAAFATQLHWFGCTPLTNADAGCANVPFARAA